MNRPRTHRPHTHALKRTMGIALLTGLPGLLSTLFLLVLGGHSSAVWVAVLYLLLFFWLVLIWMLLESIRRPWQVLSNILSAFREHDFSMRGSGPDPNDPVGLAMWETNALADQLQEERRLRLERHRLFDKVLNETDIAVFCFDPARRLVIVNPYAAQLFNARPDQLIGRSLEQLGLGFALSAAYATGHQHAFPARESRWLVKHGTYREEGRPHRLVLLADIRATLREEELGAWRRLTRVLGHELINSMTPMKTMAVGMQRLVRQDPLPADWREDLQEACRVIADRVDNLARFVKNYSQIARQPMPQKREFALHSLVQRLLQTEPFHRIDWDPSPEVTLFADEAQLEQVLINLMKNALEALANGQGEVQVGWKLDSASDLNLYVLDQGHGISNPDNLFVPYFTTKSEGNGIGLIVSRQIIEAHGGTLSLQNRERGPGCRATILLPLRSDSNAAPAEPVKD